MNTPKRNVSLITLFFIPIAVASIDNCSTSRCFVTSPFRTSDQPPTCGLPGFDLSCDFPYNKPLLSFPSPGHAFSVDSIYYSSKLVTLSDPEGCLQNKLLRFDPSGTPFRFENPAYLPLYNCSRSKLPYSYQGREISCLSGSNYSVLWDNNNGSLSTYYKCLFIGDAMGPKRWIHYTFMFNNATSVDLTWDLPVGCQSCDYSCQRDPHDPTRVTCPASASPPVKDIADTAKIVLPIIVVTILLALIFLGLYCKARRIAAAARNSTRGSVTNDTTVVEQVHLNVTSNQNRVLPLGVEQDSLDAYPTIVVGESSRILVNMEDEICPICLSEYAPKETLKTMPECLHRFHADCIDEWLRAKALCPVCRTPPPRRLS